MGRHELPRHFGDSACRDIAAEAQDGSPWWLTPIAAALVDLSRVDGFVAAFAGVATALRQGESYERVVGRSDVNAAFQVALEWLDADVAPSDVGSWIQAGCWDPRMAEQLAAAGLEPSELLDDQGQPAHRVEAPDGEDIPLARAVVEWDMPIAEALSVARRRRLPVEHAAHVP